MIGGSSYLSRIAVVFAFPTAILCGYLNQFVWLFKRKRGISREWFTEFFRKNWAVRYSFSLILPVKENKQSISENDISSLVKKMLVSNSSPVWQNYSCTFDFSLDDCSVSIEITKNEKDKIAGNVFLSYPEIQLEDYEISFVADYEKGVIDFQNKAKGDFVSDYEDELAALLEEELQKDIPELDEER